MKITELQLRRIIREAYEGSPQQDLDRYLSDTFKGRREDLNQYLVQAGWSAPEEKGEDDENLKAAT